MNLRQVENSIGKTVRLDTWPWKCFSIKAYKNVYFSVNDFGDNPYFILNKLTKGGMCMISKDGWRGSISVAPSWLSEWESRDD